jgi:hypothetical protein
MLKKLINLLGLCLAFATTLQGQDLGNSPYSQVGLGDINYQGFTHQQAFGKTGVSYSLPFHINNTNAALLPQNKRTIFEAGVTAQSKLLSEEGNTQKDFGGSLSYLVLAFPVSKKWTSSLGITPFSSVNYENVFLQKVNNSDFTADIKYRGSGGLTSFFLGNGVEIIKPKSYRPDTLKSYQKLSLGLKTSYIFGSIVDEVISQLNTGANEKDITYNMDYYKRTHFSDFIFEPGIYFSQKLDKYRLHFGLNYQLKQNLNSKRFGAIFRGPYGNTDSSIDNAVSVDTIQNNIKGVIALPQKITFGTTFEKIDDRSGLAKWAVSGEVSFQDWKGFKDFDSETFLENSYTAGLGFQYMPEFASVKKGFWRRSVYRAGVHYAQVPLILNNERITDMSVSLGTSMPFGRSSTLLNLGVSVGKKGTIAKGLVEDKYFKIHLGITINDTWFVKPKYD